MKQKILIIEDDDILSSAIANALKQEFTVTTIANPHDITFDLNLADLALLDINLQNPNTDGLTLCKTLKTIYPEMPVIMISAHSQLQKKLKAFKYGADDYLCKPFEIAELKARIYANLKGHKNLLSANGVVLNKEDRKVYINQKHIELRKKEFDLLEILLVNKGRVMSRDKLLALLWPHDTTESNTIDVHIRHIRQSIDKHLKKPLIKTVYGIGYTIENQ